MLKILALYLCHNATNLDELLQKFMVQEKIVYAKPRLTEDEKANVDFFFKTRYREES